MQYSNFLLFYGSDIIKSLNIKYELLIGGQKTNILEKLFYMGYFFIRGKPLQVGYFFSYEMKKKIEEIHKDYDCIIFHLLPTHLWL